MARATHTPGPWSITEHSWKDTGIYGADHSHVAALSLGIEDEEDEGAIEEESAIVAANARLVAGAPDLLAILKRAGEELRLIRMKDCPAVYDVTLRLEIDLILNKVEG